MIIIAEYNSREINFSVFKKENGFSSFTKNIEEIQDEASVSKILRLVSKGEKPKALAFKLPFGGDIFKEPVALDDDFFIEFKKLTPFMPFYVPPASAILEAFYKCVKNIPIIVFFETAFFSRLPEPEKYYAIASEYLDKSRIKRWGFHGLFHEFNAAIDKKQHKTISIVLDKQTTVSAISGNKPLTISLGYTPLEGIMSRTSCGDIDPGIVFYLMKMQDFSIFKIDDILKKESGFFGLTGYNISINELAKLYGKDSKVDLAFSVYENQILKYIGEGISVLGGLDTVVFSGNNIEALKSFIYHLVKKISFLGINLKDLPWVKDEDIVCISSDLSKVNVYINYTESSKIVYNRLMKYVN